MKNIQNPLGKRKEKLESFIEENPKPQKLGRPSK
jgi:hypothetical protein